MMSGQLVKRADKRY